MSESADNPAALGVRLLGLENAAAAFDQARSIGRLHHAWLLTGPKGLGKAAFAHRMARLLLGATPDPSGGPGASRCDDPVNRLIAARAHPDFILLDRTDEDGKQRRSISVDDARRLPEFFSKAPALAAYRVAVIDAAEDMNVNAANAVLKTLEEPPPRGVLFLVSHAPGKLLPTIRSRCRRLAFRPWKDEAVTDFLVAHEGLSPEEARLRASLAGGSPGRALALADSEARKVDEAALSLLKTLPERVDPLIVNLADGFRGGQGAERFSLFLERLADHVARRVLEDDGLSGQSRAAWSLAWEGLVALPGEAEAVNLDRADALVSVIERLSETSRRHPLFST